MSKTIGLIVCVIGVVLVVFGVSASESITSDISRFFTGTPTDKAIWLLIGGVVLVLIGISGMFMGRREGP